MKKNQLSIRIYGEQVGILEQTASGKKIFTYDNAAVTPISLSMPIREEPYGEQQCEAFFAGFLPESYQTRQIIGKRYGISANNSFALLKAIGHDCAGAISCHEMDESIIAQRSVPLTGKMIDDNELYTHIKDLPQKPLFMDVDGLRLSLAGVQDKAAVCLIDKQIAFPENDCPTTHILKPASSRFAEIAENEYFILKLAKRIGLPVAEVELRKIKDITFLLVERFDRRIKNNTIERIHQEDFCQALSIPSNKKYQNEGGPGLKNCFDLLNNTTLPAVDRNILAFAIIFNYLIGNMDAHGKNFSLLHNTIENIRLAPFYDMVCTRVYRDLSDKMAMKIGSKYHADDVLPRHWQQLCEESNYRYIAMKRLIEKIANQLLKAAVEEKEQLKADGILSPVIDNIISVMNTHIERTLKRFEER